MHDSITDLANDFVMRLEDMDFATFIRHQVKTKYQLQGKIYNLFLLIIRYSDNIYIYINYIS